MPEKIIVLATNGPGAPAPEKGAASPESLVSGEYKTTTYNHWTGENDRLYCGIWECSPGKVKVDYAEWEYCYFIEGKAILTNEAGESWTLKKGDGFIIPPGFKGTWETVEPVKKHYVILMPPPAA
ncbi:MAG: cupin domain-containing protein [Hyphomicrobiales bacterium]